MEEGHTAMEREGGKTVGTQFLAIHIFAMGQSWPGSASRGTPAVEVALRSADRG